MKVLVTDGSTGQAHGALSAVRTLAQAGHAVDVTVSGPLSVAGWSRHSRRRHRVPPADTPGYADAVRRLRDEERYDVVFPASDAALLRLEWPGAELVDKQRLHDRAAAVGLPTPAQWTFDSGEELVRSAGDVRWPVVVKAAAKSSELAHPAFRADSPTDLGPLAGSRHPVVLEEWLAGEQVAVSGVMWGGRLRAVTHQRYVRSWPRQCGIAAYAVTAQPDERLEAGLARLLADHDGVFQCQLIDGRLHDVNPRVFGSMALSARAGVNLLDVVCRLTSGEDLGARTPLRARPGVAYRWIEGDLRHLGEARRCGDLTTGETLGALRPRRGTAHPDIWPSDPGPTLARFGYAVRARKADR